MQKITVPDRATKLQLAVLLLNAQSAMARAMTPTEENAKWKANHSGKDELLKEVKRHNLSIDESGKETDPYRFNKIVSAYCMRVQERFNFTEEVSRSLQRETVRFFAEWNDVLGESEVPAAIAKAKAIFRRMLPALLERQQEPRSFFHLEYTRNLHDPIKKLRIRDEEFIGCEKLLAALWDGVGDCYDEQEALEKAIQKRMAILRLDTERQQVSLKYGKIVFHALCEQFGVNIAAEMTREERDALQRAVREGVLARKDLAYSKVG